MSWKRSTWSQSEGVSSDVSQQPGRDHFLVERGISPGGCRRCRADRAQATVKIDLPDSDKMFPDGPGADAINSNCLACHSADMVFNQPALSKLAWTAEVRKMINNYKAPVAPEDVDPIVNYLTALKGAK
jgi:hypothetical protein